METILDLEEDVSPEVVYEDDSFSRDDEDSTYWAANEDPHEVAEALLNRIREGHERLARSSHYAMVCRNGLYYYNQSPLGDDIDSDTMIRVRGEHGETIEFSAAYFRYFLRQQLALITAESPNFDVAALNADKASRAGARLGKQILKAYQENKNLDAELVATAENALAHSCGALAVIWDYDLGVAFDASEEEADEFSGDVKFMALEPGIDMGWDFCHQAPWEEQMWCYIDRWVNKWELIARFPHLKDDILDEGDGTDFWSDDGELEDSDDLEPRRDQIRLRYFYHRAGMAIPEGREIIFAGGTYIEEGANLYGELPVYMMRPSRYGRDVWGWSPGFDIQGQHEMLCEILSKLATKLDSLGVVLIHAKPGSELPPPEDWVAGVPNYVRSNEPPTVLDLGTVDPATFMALDRVILDMERITGVTSGTQGTAGSNLRSNAQQVHQTERSRQYHGQFQSAWAKLRQQAGQAILRILEKFPDEERRIQVIGRSGAAEMLTFDPAQLENAKAVTIRQGPSGMQTMEGRYAFLESLSKFPSVEVDWEQAVSVMEGAPLETMTRRQNAQVELAQEENERLQFDAQYDHPAMITDDHLLHIMEHASILSHPATREDDDLAIRVEDAILDHLELMQSEMGVKLGVLLGFDKSGIGLQLQQLGAAEQAVADQEGEESTPPIQQGAA